MFPNFWTQRAQPYQFQQPQFAGMQPPQMQPPMGMQPPMQGFQNPFASRMPMGAPPQMGAPISMMRPAMGDGQPPIQPQPFQPQMPPQAMPQQMPMQQMPMQANNNFMRARMAM